MSLQQVGATDQVYARFAPFASQGLILGRVIRLDRSEYTVILENEERRAEAAGSLLYHASEASALPAIGDWVGLDGPLIRAVLPRTTQFSRRAAGRRIDQQIIAANIDLVFLMSGLDRDFNLRRIERYLTLTWESGARPVILLNKADVCEEVGRHEDQVARVAPGVTILSISAQAGLGLENVKKLICRECTVALLGSSGVGKSTLVNRLLGETRQRTQEVREEDARGRHTTTYRELIPLADGGVLIDTPGMRELQLWASENSVARTFEEIAELASQCRFGDCQHTGEPGCAVAQALQRGELDAERYESYCKQQKEVARHEQKNDVLATQREKRHLKNLMKAAKAMYKQRGR